MRKSCECGQEKTMNLRTVIYSSKVEIEHVPVFSCAACLASEVYSGVKAHLTELISSLDESPSKQMISFPEFNEFAHLMFMLSDQEQLDIPVEEIIEHRINELLDLLLLAQSLDDEQWKHDIQQRLLQITEQAVKIFDFS